MNLRQFAILAAAAVAALTSSAQDKPGTAAPNNTPVIKTETRLVLVDTIVTDKKGNYIRDLQMKDFKVWEDNKEQQVKTFSFGSDAGMNPAAQKHYLVLFFDNSNMNLSDQGRARIAAGKFIDANASADKYMAVVNYGGMLKVSQNFTTDADRLKQIVKGMQIPIGPSYASLGGPSLSDAEADFAASTSLYALKALAKSLSAVPGRKSVVLLTAGFPTTDPSIHSQIESVIDACNRANVAIYPIDVRGLDSGITAVAATRAPGHLRPAQLHNQSGTLQRAILHSSGRTPSGARLVYVGGQRTGGGGGGAGGGGGGRGGGGGGGGTGAGGGGGRGAGGGGGAVGGGPRGGGGVSRGPTGPIGGMPGRQGPTLIPPIPPSAATNQQVMYELANGTGGFPIVNNNDMLGGMERISREQGEYYILGYAPESGGDGKCHTLKVKVDRGGTQVRFRSGYCSVKPVDMLAGKPVEKDLESRANGDQPGTMIASLQAPFFFSSPNTARVDLSMQIPGSAIKFNKEHGKYKSTLNVLGLAYKPDGTVGARFSDAVDLEFDDKKQAEEIEKGAYVYRNQFQIGSGKYTLKVAFNSGEQAFGKIEIPLEIDSYDQKHLGMSAVALSKDVHRLDAITSGLDAQLLADRRPMIVQGLEIIPAGDLHFNKTDKAALYLEIYDPKLVEAQHPKLFVDIAVLDRKTGKPILHTGKQDIDGMVKAGSPLVPVGLHLPVEQLAAGSYTLELWAAEENGEKSGPRVTHFEIN